MVAGREWGAILLIVCCLDLCLSGKRPTLTNINNFSSILKSKVTIRVLTVNCTYKTGYYKVTCLFEPKSENSTSGELNVRINIMKVQEEAFMEMKGSSKNRGSTTYNRVFFRQKIDYCQLAQNGNNVPNLLTQFAPGLFKSIVLPMCPIVGIHDLNITVPSVSLDAMIVRNREYKIELTFISATDVNLWKLTAFMLAKDDE